MALRPGSIDVVGVTGPRSETGSASAEEAAVKALEASFLCRFPSAAALSAAVVQDPALKSCGRNSLDAAQCSRAVLRAQQRLPAGSPAQSIPRRDGETDSASDLV